MMGTDREVLLDLLTAVGRIEGRLEGIEKEQKRVADYTATTSTRVGALEVSRAQLLGWAAGAGAVAAVAISFLMGLWKTLKGIV